MDYQDLLAALVTMYDQSAGIMTASYPADKAREVWDYLDGLDKESLRRIMSDVLIDLYLNDKSIEQGSGPLDVYGFLDWFYDGS